MDINPNAESAKTQKQRILAILRSGRRPTNYELIKMHCGIDTRKRISELREEGYDIKSEPFRCVNANGHSVTFVRYHLISEPEKK